MPLKARPIGEVTVPALLADKTLRSGDIVVFPDGRRLFKGSRTNKGCGDPRRHAGGRWHLCCDCMTLDDVESCINKRYDRGSLPPRAEPARPSCLVSG